MSNKKVIMDNDKKENEGNLYRVYEEVNKRQIPLKKWMEIRDKKI